ncbi:MAG: lipid-A-disaccharide synthase [Prevotella sp.]|nr:lipid-A-disaccharide synthase [Prevotella sp.]
MKYYLIAGEASGDLHASQLMLALKELDGDAQFRFYGGDQMQAAGGTLVKHYRELAYMGFIPVLMHLHTILGNMRRAKKDIAQWRPDVVILVDYPGFNLSIAKYVRKKALAPVYYYISPKIWAWKEYRIKNIKRDISELFSILPFEVEFFEKKHHYPIHYVGNPTMDEVSRYLDSVKETGGEAASLPFSSERKVIALLAGSRRQEINDNLPAMISVSRKFPQYQFVVAGAPGIEAEYYDRFLAGTEVKLVHNRTYALLHHSHAALVTSGTATLETALFGVPQVVCYETMLPRLVGWLRKKVLKVKYVSLVNLIADREVVRELVADSFSEANIKRELEAVLEGPAREAMLQGYREVHKRLGQQNAPHNAARIITELLKK